MSSIGIVIPTYQAAKHLPQCLSPLLDSALKPRILVIDSSSSDGTVDLAHSLGAETMCIPKQAFDHGLTRELGRKHLNTDIVVMLTQDAYPASSDMLEKLIAPIMKREASISYARQLPHRHAGYFGAFARKFNYANESHIRSLQDIDKHGVYTFFCSNSCAAYLNQALDEVGGFPSVLFGEDTIMVAKLLHQNHRIAYVAEAEVYHSHDYTLKEEFKRHFDMGLSRASFQHLLSAAGKDTRRGKLYAAALLQDLWQVKASLIPYALLHILSKYLGYKTGRACLRAPLWLKKNLSSQKSFWDRSNRHLD